MAGSPVPRVRTRRTLGLRVAVPVTAAVVVAISVASVGSDGSEAHQGAAPGPVSATMHVDAAMKYPYATIAGLVDAPQTSTIVVGTVGSVDYQSVDGLAMTTYRVDVSQALRGTPPATITIREDGGYLPASQINAETQEKFPDSTPALDPNSFVDVPFEGAAHPAAGQHVLLFLMNDPNTGRAGDYVGVMSAFSRFDQVAGASYRRAALVDGMEGTVTLDAVKSLLS